LARKGQTSATDVFINCPFDVKYQDIFRALIFTIYACGFRPRSAREIDDGGEARIEKLFGIIAECRYGIHDLSRTELDRAHRLPRFNMPLELGMFLGAKRYGGTAQKEKRLLIFDVEQYRYQKFISDLAGMDIHAHGGNSDTAIKETRNWLANVSRRHLRGASQIVRFHQQFSTSLPQLAKQIGLKLADVSYADYERLVAKWLESR
jgi:hypothetical protein